MNIFDGDSVTVVGAGFCESVHHLYGAHEA